MASFNRDFVRFPDIVQVRLIVLLMLFAGLIGCGGENGTVSPAASSSAGTKGEAVDAAAVAELCDAWGVADAEQLAELLRRAAPRELQRAVAVTNGMVARQLDALESGEDAADVVPTAAETSAQRSVISWLHTTCAETVLKVAPPVTDLPEGARVCRAEVTPPAKPAAPTSSVVVYGERARDDPYAGPLLSLAWHAGSSASGRGSPARTRGGVEVRLSDDRDPQGVTIHWQTNGAPRELVGRGWSSAESDELLDMVDAITSGEGGETLAIPTEALPSGFEQVYSGPLTMLMLPGSAEFTIGLSVPAGRADSAEVSFLLIGASTPPGAENLWRLTAPATERIDIAGKAVAFTSTPRDHAGPVASWRVDPDHHVEVVISSSAEGESVHSIVRDVVAASRPLTADEWAELVAAVGPC